MVAKNEAASKGKTQGRRTDDDALDEVLNHGKESAGSESKPAFAESTARSVSGDSSIDGTLDSSGSESVEANPELLNVVQLPVRVELGRRQLPLKDALDLRAGSVVDLEKLAEEPVDLYVNDLLFARGEVLVVDDCFCVRVTEINPRAKTMGSDS